MHYSAVVDTNTKRSVLINLLWLIETRKFCPIRVSRATERELRNWNQVATRNYPWQFLP